MRDGSLGFGSQLPEPKEPVADGTGSTLLTSGTSESVTAPIGLTNRQVALQAAATVWSGACGNVRFPGSMQSTAEQFEKWLDRGVDDG